MGGRPVLVMVLAIIPKNVLIGFPSDVPGNYGVSSGSVIPNHLMGQARIVTMVPFYMLRLATLGPLGLAGAIATSKKVPLLRCLSHTLPRKHSSQSPPSSVGPPFSLRALLRSVVIGRLAWFFVAQI